MSVVVISDVNAWKGGNVVESAREPALEAAIAAATSWVEREGGRRSLEKKRVTVTIDGSRAEGYGRTDLWLPSDLRPVWHLAPDDLVAVSEDGAALTMASGYSSSADVRVRNANEDSPVMLFRYGGWYADRQNVVASLTVGWDTDPAATFMPLPAAVRQLVVELSWSMFNGATKLGKSSVSKSGASVSIEDSLSPASLSTLNSMRDF